MERLTLDKSAHTPMIDFDPSGKLKMEGRSFPEDVMKFYQPLIDYVSALKSTEVTLDVNMDYFNTASSHKMLDMFKHLEANSNIQKVTINWHYEEGDEDSLEIAEIYEEALLRCKFFYHEFAETEY